MVVEVLTFLVLLERVVIHQQDYLVEHQSPLVLAVAVVVTLAELTQVLVEMHLVLIQSLWEAMEELDLHNKVVDLLL